MTSSGTSKEANRGSPNAIRMGTMIICQTARRGTHTVASHSSASRLHRDRVTLRAASTDSCMDHDHFVLVVVKISKSLSELSSPSLSLDARRLSPAAIMRRWDWLLRCRNPNALTCVGVSCMAVSLSSPSLPSPSPSKEIWLPIEPRDALESLRCTH
jgi:hypothetical protein